MGLDVTADGNHFSCVGYEVAPPPPPLSPPNVQASQRRRIMKAGGGGGNGGPGDDIIDAALFIKFVLFFVGIGCSAGY